MAQMSLPTEKTDLSGRRSVNDPAVGIGRKQSHICFRT
jgi:hypothetical protein